MPIPELGHQRPLLTRNHQKPDQEQRDQRKQQDEPTAGQEPKPEPENEARGEPVVTTLAGSTVAQCRSAADR